MTTLGLDLSLTATGLAFYDGKEAIVSLITSKPTQGTRAEDERLWNILTSIGHAISLHKPALVAVEGISFGSKGRGMFQQAGLHYLVRNWLLLQNVPYTVIPPTVVKKWASGKGNSRKDDMKLHAYKLYGFEHKDDNCVDAYLLARLAAQITGQEKPKNKAQEEVLANLTTPNQGG